MSDFSTYHRLASVVLVSTEGRVQGLLPAVRLSTPWCQEVSELVDAYRARDGIELTILRLLSVDESAAPELRVEYLAELRSGSAPLALSPWNGKLEDQPLRLPYAQVGGPQRDLDWAAAELAKGGFGQVTGARQIRTWNLSSIWKLDVDGTPFWLKCVPPFFAHEGAVLELFEGERVPRLVAADGGRVLLHDIPGADFYQASAEQVVRMVELLVDLQWRWRSRVDALQRAGLPVVRQDNYLAALRRTADLAGPLLNAETARHLEAVLRVFPAHLNEFFALGFPETLVHGDCHPGNWRGTGLDLTLMDWGDCVIGHPLLDVPAMLERCGAHADVARQRWIELWRERLPNADVERGMALAEPIALARMATVYQGFLDRIEPSERIYHHHDPRDCLTRLVDQFGERLLA